MPGKNNIRTQGAGIAHDDSTILSQSSEAISAILAISTYSLGFTALVLAVVAVFGWTSIRSMCVESAKILAKREVKNYFHSEAFNERLEREIRAATARHKENQNAVAVEAGDETGVDPEFGAPPDGRGA